jgi:hypothetical protein
MKKRRYALLIDAVFNLILGILLLAYSHDLAEFFGVPKSESAFYPNILGAVFIGITLALIIEAYRPKLTAGDGLGLIGAISINLCGGIVLLIWLIWGNLDLPVHGMVILWIIAIFLLVISSLEFFYSFRKVSNDLM